MTIRPAWGPGDAAAALEADLAAFTSDAREDAGTDAAEERMGDLLKRAEVLTQAAAAATASQASAILFAVLAAKRAPDTYVLADAKLSRKERVEFAERAVVFELSMRLSMSENTVRAHFHMAETLIRRLPAMWAYFRDGLIPLVNARTAAQTAYSLPDDPEVNRALDEALAGPATMLTAGKFTTKARVTRERLHPKDPTDRHESARAGRRIYTEPVDDSMAWLHLYMDATTIEAARRRLHANAIHLRNQDGETRALAQIEADITGDLLTGAGTPYEVKTRLGITIPVTAFSDDPELLKKAHTGPAILDGYGPIDPATARALAAVAPAFRRIFTDPIDGTVLTLDRTTYRPTAGLREYLNLKYRTCGAPGCNRPADECDIDHTLDWHHGGPTNENNLAPLHEGHHTVRHATRITVTRNRHGGITWRTPTGFSKDNDPPPF